VARPLHRAAHGPPPRPGEDFRPQRSRSCAKKNFPTRPQIGFILPDEARIAPTDHPEPVEGPPASPPAARAPILPGAAPLTTRRLDRVQAGRFPRIPRRDRIGHGRGGDGRDEPQGRLPAARAARRGELRGRLGRSVRVAGTEGDGRRTSSSPPTTARSTCGSSAVGTAGRTKCRILRRFYGWCATSIRVTGTGIEGLGR
jgi:hypothetical protein